MLRPRIFLGSSLLLAAALGVAGCGSSGSSSTDSIGSPAVRSSFSSAITFLIEARMSSIEGSRPGDCIRPLYIYWGGGVTPGVTGGDGSIRAESICGVTTGLAGSSSGLTVRVATVGCLGSLAQSFQLPATWR